VKTKYIIGIIIVLAFTAWGVSAFFKYTVQYVSFSEARTSNRTVQVAGTVNQDNVTYDADKAQLLFTIYDTDSTASSAPDSLIIVYHGVVPGNFGQATSVMVRGKAGDGVFEAEKLFVKCPSKYQGITQNYQDNE
jgi:cytochrome c-type biogenesis protein CcmE